MRARMLGGVPRLTYTEIHTLTPTDGLEVWDTTYKIPVRGDGTYWVPQTALIPITGIAPNDSVSGTIAETAFRSVSFPSKYVGPFGRVLYNAQVIAGNTTANTKGFRVRCGPAGDLTDTLVTSTGSAIAGSLINYNVDKAILAAGGSTAAQRCSNLGSSTTGSGGATSGAQITLTNDFGATDLQNLTFSAILQSAAGGGESLTMNFANVWVIPGF